MRETVFTAIVLFLFTPYFSSAQVKQPGGFFSQRVIVAAGAGYSLPEENTPASAGVLFVPQIFLTTAYSDFSVSINPAPELFYSLSGSQGASKKLFFQSPVIAHVNLGHLASKDFHGAVGAYLGAGWNFQFGRGTGTNGLAFDGGVRFWLFGQSFTAAYERLISNEKIFSSPDFFSLQINLGKYLSQVKANNKVSNFMKPYRNKK